jgi:hypothetical protein
MSIRSSSFGTAWAQREYCASVQQRQWPYLPFGHREPGILLAADLWTGILSEWRVNRCLGFADNQAGEDGFQK